MNWGDISVYNSTTNPVFLMSREEWFWMYGWKTCLFIGTVSVLLIILWREYKYWPINKLKRGVN